MRPHTVDLQGSFFADLAFLDSLTCSEVMTIVAELDRQATFEPLEPPFYADYVYEYRDGKCACQHVSGWDGWRLEWFFETYEDDIDTVETVVLSLVNRGLFFEVQNLLPN